MAGAEYEDGFGWTTTRRLGKGFEWGINPQFLRDSRWYSKSSEPFLFLSIWFAISSARYPFSLPFTIVGGWYQKTKEIIYTQMMIIYQISQPSWNRIGALGIPWHALSICTPSSCLFSWQNKIAILSLGAEKVETHRRWRCMCVFVFRRSKFNVINVKTLFTF